MFQSDGNYLSSSSSVWNFQYLRKILQVPQDQYNLLKNIPGWSTKEKAIVKNTVQYREDKNKTPNYSFANQKLLKETVEKFKQKKNISFQQNSLYLNSNHSLFKKSTSLDSLDKLKDSLSVEIKRSTSFPTLVDSMVSLKSSSADFKNVCPPPLSIKSADRFGRTSNLTNSKSDGEATVADDLDDLKAQFMDSAVQCQMSQSSQSNLDMSLASRIPLATVNKHVNLDKEDIIGKSSTKNITANKHNLSIINSVHTPRNDISDKDFVEKSTLKNSSPTSNVEYDQTLILSKLDVKSHIPLQEKSKFVEESFLSQPIPCAQPLLSDVSVQNEYPSTLSTVHNTDFNIKANSVENKNNQVIGKRKRKNKVEKIPKKFRAMNNVEVSYSSEQIKNMIQLIKIFNEL